MGRHVRKGDTVEVLSGKHKGKRGKILEILIDRDRVRIEGVNVIKRHLKPGRDPKIPQGGIIEKFGTIHISNVLPVDPQSGKASRVGRKFLEGSGKRSRSKVRVTKQSGETLAQKGV